MRLATIVLLLASCAGPALAGSLPRWIPEQCVEAATYDPSPATGSGTDAGSRWNEAYRRGRLAIERGAHAEAESAMCRAALAAREFDPRDWRFAETLDELGLIAFELRDFELAERVQGAAIAEMLLAVGPHGEPLRGNDNSTRSPIRPDCRSGVAVYTRRLGWIHEKTDGRIATETLVHEPWRVFAAGYLPLDPDLAQRLDWLVSRYLLEENLVAADALSDLQRRVRADTP